jgi:ABC-2 type transport system ATP-binding protein
VHIESAEAWLAESDAEYFVNASSVFRVTFPSALHHFRLFHAHLREIGAEIMETEFNKNGMLRVTSLTKSYASVPAVQNVSFDLNPGDVLGCIGPNGSGKSTTVKMITGLIKPSCGEVLFRGKDIFRDVVSYRKRLGYVPEEPNLYPYLSAQEYLEIVGTLRRISQKVLHKKIENLLLLFSLYSNRHSLLASYSKGMRQRILLIAALLDDPELIVLDEPLSGLDVTSVLIVKNLIRALGQNGKAILYCSHVLEVVERVCSHVLILRKGTVVASGTTADIQKRLGHASLEGTVHSLLEDADPDQITREIIEVIRAT